jgi:hypothetical protein
VIIPVCGIAGIIEFGNHIIISAQVLGQPVDNDYDSFGLGNQVCFREQGNVWGNLHGILNAVG